MMYNAIVRMDTMQLNFTMQLLLHLFLSIIFVNSTSANNYCREILQDENIKQINWSYLRQCLIAVNGEDTRMSKNISVNVWRLMKLAFDNIDNIPAESYKYMGYTLTVIPVEELRNISMENIDVIEAFGAIRSIDGMRHQDGFKPEQLNIIAHKVREEWLGKNPQTYSEYDLRSMGEILCYLNVTDIDNIHADAFKEAAEWIGMIEQCPRDRLQALANLAKRPEAFGEPQKWSKIEVSIIGNILNGLSGSEINSIAKDKLKLNHFYKSSNTKPQATNKITELGAIPSTSSSSSINSTKMEASQNKTEN